MIRLQQEKIADVRAEIAPLLLAHWAEISSHPGQIKLNPDWDRYYALEEMGALKIYTARDVSVTDETIHHKKLVGYFVAFVMPNIHYRDHVYALNDIVYLDPAHRGKTTGYRLFKYSIEQLKGCGVSVITVHMKVKHQFRGLLRALGFQCTEENWELKL